MSCIDGTTFSPQLLLRIEIWRRKTHQRRPTVCELNQDDVRVQSQGDAPSGKNPMQQMISTSGSPVNVNDIRVDLESDRSLSISHKSTESRETLEEIERGTRRRLSELQREQSVTVTLHNENWQEMCPVEVDPVVRLNYSIL